MAFSMKLPATKKTTRASPGGAPGAKQYGLILPTKKDAKKDITPASVFVAAADDTGKHTTSTNEDKAAARRRVGTEAARSLQRAQIERTHTQALAEDASVFDYDGVYDAIQNAKETKKRDRKAQRESEKQSAKYISTLLEKAKVREIELERIRERRLLKERASEDALYGDKEKLVSASYKRKLQDLKRWDDEDKRMDAIEAAEDVTTRGGDAMAGFYSNLLTKNLAMGGAAANAQSAYTVGRRDAAETLSRHVEAEEPREAKKTEPPQDEPFAAKKARVEEEDSENVDQAPTKPVSVVTPVVVAVPTKDETISAARARFLARKAARQQLGP